MEYVSTVDCAACFVFGFCILQLLYVVDVEC